MTLLRCRWAAVPRRTTNSARKSVSLNPPLRWATTVSTPSNFKSPVQPQPRKNIRTDSKEEDESHKLSPQESLVKKLQRSFRPPDILFENEKVLVINKPAGCALQADEGSEAFIRWDLISKYFEDRYGKLFMVHRLDKSTSGPLILARSSSSARTLSTQFRNSTIKKRYLALIQFLPHRKGPIQDAKNLGRIDCRIRNRNDRMVIVESNRTGIECKSAVTDWEVVTATATHAIIGLMPETGRKHQLRLHCSRLLSSPIVGDFKYDFRYLHDKSKKCIEEFLKRDSESRIMLHASEIEFKIYRKEEPKELNVRVKAPLPDDFRILCDQLDLCTEDLRN